MNRRDFLHALGALGALGFPLSDFAVARPVARMLDAPPAQRRTDTNANTDDERPRIGLVAIGGAACGMLPRLVGKLPYLTRSVAIDTSARAITHARANTSILLHDSVRRAESPEAAAALAVAARPAIAAAIADLDLVFILVGLGGRAGSGIAPVVAAVARDLDIFSVGAPILPFDFEGQRRRTLALVSAKAMRPGVTALYPLDNRAFALAAKDDVPMVEVIASVTDNFIDLYRGIVKPVTETSWIGFDFADMRLMHGQEGLSACATASSASMKSILAAFAQAVVQPSLGQARFGMASNVMVSIEGDLRGSRLAEVGEAIASIREQCGEHVDLSFSLLPSEAPNMPCKVTVLATGIPA